MEKEWQCWGPPGTGKTTWLVAQIERATVVSRNVLIATLTKAAAAEIRGRGLLGRVSRDAIGTLHSHAYRALERPQLVVGKAEYLADWNAHCSPAFRLSGFQGDKAAEGQRSRKTRTSGDVQLERYYLARSRLQDTRGTVGLFPQFVSEFESWKSASGLMDFSDLIHRGMDLDHAPGQPRFVFVDEAQDHDMAELRLLRYWAAHDSCEKIILVGDPDQAIYEWRGAMPKAFLRDDLPPEQIKTLKQSYRVSKAVYKEARKMITRIRHRVDVAYEPRDCDGLVSRPTICFTNGHAKRIAADTARELARDMLPASAMFLASCSHFLSPLIRELKDEGVPFHNPYSGSKSWNPLELKPIKAARAFLMPRDDLWGDDARLWTWSDLSLWTSIIRSRGLLLDKTKEEITKRAKDSPDEPADINWFEERFKCKQSAESMKDCTLPWLANRCKSEQHVKAVSYLDRIIGRHGVKALSEEPKVIVGTIHSVKGGEATTVYLSPDLSPSGMKDYSINKDPTHRLFYVGMTRAKDTLVLCKAANPRMAIRW